MNIIYIYDQSLLTSNPFAKDRDGNKQEDNEE